LSEGAGSGMMAGIMKARTQITKRERTVDVSLVFDLGASNVPTNIARDKDEMIGDAVWEEYLEETGQKPKGGAIERRDDCC
jgi:hypothetical protein